MNGWMCSRSTVVFVYRQRLSRTGLHNREGPPFGLPEVVDPAHHLPVGCVAAEGKRLRQHRMTGHRAFKPYTHPTANRMLCCSSIGMDPTFSMPGSAEPHLVEDASYARLRYAQAHVSRNLTVVYIDPKRLLCVAVHFSDVLASYIGG